jgi:hypothetical protein
VRDFQTVLPTPDPDSVLLQTDPKGLVLAYQGMVNTIVRKFIGSGMFSGESHADVVQSINAELLERIYKIQVNYNGSTLVRTYVSAVIRNICLKLHKQRMYRKPVDPLVTEKLLTPVGMIDRYSIGQARRATWAIMQQFGRDLPKLTICLKLRYQIALKRKDILRWYPECSPVVISQLMAHFGAHPVHETDKDKYAFVTPIFNAAEKRNNSPDALRKWTALKILEILNLLNSSIAQAAFDEESLRILLEDYFFPFLLKD